MNNARKADRSGQARDHRRLEPEESRRLTNFSTGRLGTELGNHLVAAGHQVTVVAGTVNYATGRAPERVALVEAYAKEQGLWHDPSREPAFSEYLELDLADVVSEREHGYDTKFAMHALRLGVQGVVEGHALVVGLAQLPVESRRPLANLPSKKQTAPTKKCPWRPNDRLVPTLTPAKG